MEFELKQNIHWCIQRSYIQEFGLDIHKKPSRSPCQTSRSSKAQGRTHRANYSGRAEKRVGVRHAGGSHVALGCSIVSVAEIVGKGIDVSV